MNTRALAILCLCMLADGLPLQAQPSAFSYQGRLNDRGRPATGLYDLRFTLFDSAGGAGAVWTGTEMIVWGGGQSIPMGGLYFIETFSYTPGSLFYLYQKP